MCVCVAQVDTRIRAEDEHGTSAIMCKLGNASALMATLNKALTVQGLEPATHVTPPSFSPPSPSPPTSAPTGMLQGGDIAAGAPQPESSGSGSVAVPVAAVVGVSTGVGFALLLATAVWFHRSNGRTRVMSVPERVRSSGQMSPMTMPSLELPPDRTPITSIVSLESESPKPETVRVREPEAGNC